MSAIGVLQPVQFALWRAIQAQWYRRVCIVRDCLSVGLGELMMVQGAF